jgi:hypothetical protein
MIDQKWAIEVSNVLFYIFRIDYKLIDQIRKCSVCKYDYLMIFCVN